MSAQSSVAAALRPFWGRVTVSESPVDESETSSGLIVPIKHEGDDGILRGMVLHCSDRYSNGVPITTGLDFEPGGLLAPGTVVYYSKTAALKIAGVVILHHADVLAYEEEENHGSND